MTLNEQQIQNIKNYNKEIKTIDKFPEAVRKTVTQYLGYTGNKGFINMIREIFQNSADEMMKDSSPCDEIWVAFSEPAQECMVKDNGRGIPHESMIRVFSSQHTSSNYDKKPGEFSSGRHGVGAKVTNAVAEYFIVESYILGKGKRVEFHWGDPETAKVTKLKDVKNKQGTMVTFSPITEVMGQTTVTCEDVYRLIETLIPLLKIGARINFVGKTMNGDMIERHLVNKNGLLDGIVKYSKTPIVPPIHFGGLRDDKMMKAEIVFTFDPSVNDMIVKSYGNFCPTREGTHVQGFTEGVSKFFRSYMNKFFLSEKAKNKITITNNDITGSIVAIVTCSHMTPEFTGQSKEIISNDDLVPFVRDLTVNSLEEWSKTNPSDLQKACKFIKELAEVRLRSEKERLKIKANNVSNISGLPKKFVKPTGKVGTELFIMEGDSAIGPAKNNRVNERQGLFPIRGKLTNALKRTKQEVLANQEIASIISIIGAGYGRNFDINKCKWEKVIICTDADPDGAHIRNLLLAFFLLYMRPLIENGKLYATVPPLYGGKINGKMRYFTDRTSYNIYLQKEFSKKHDIQLGDKTYIKEHDVVNILNLNMNYVRDINTIANSFAIEPKLLEYMLILESMGMAFGSAKFKKAIEKEYRFLTVSKNGIEGLLNNRYHTIYFNDVLNNSCRYIRDYLKKSYPFYIVDGQKVTLYDVMSLFESIAPSSIQRYKGLGEMNGEQLFKSTLDPSDKGGRVLIKYTIEDVEYEIDKLRNIANDYLQLLKDIDVSQYVF